MFRIGLGSDIHKFREDRPLFLSGVKIADQHGLDGHGDGDVVLHALADALLGSVAEGDLGHHEFENEGDHIDLDSDSEGTKVLSKRPDPNMAGREIISEVMGKVWSKGYRVINVDVTIFAEEPRIQPYRNVMRKTLGVMLNIPTTEVSVKASTGGGIGAVGRKEGIFAQAIVLIAKRPEREKSEF